MTTRKTKKLVFKIGFCFVMIISWSGLFFCSMELYERLRWKHILTKNELELDAQVNRAKFTQAFADSLWDQPWYSYKKNQKVTFDLDGNFFQIITNNVGLRDDYVHLPKPKKLFRILCVGGSTTVEGWTNETTYPNILEKRLQKMFRGVKLEVINGGVSGLNSYGEFNKISEYIALNPDLILENNAANDICWLYFPYLKKHSKWWKRLLMKSKFLARHLNWYLLPGEKAIQDYFERTTINNLLSLYREAARKHIPVIFSSFPRPEITQLSTKEREFLEFDLKNVWQSEFVNLESYFRLVDIYNLSLKKLCKNNGIPYVPLAENHRGGLNYFIDICHGTKKGIEKKASIIFEYLKQSLPDYF